MQSIKKKLLFLKNVIRMVFSNIPRFILSVSGLFVGLFVLAIGTLLMDSYYEECMSKANEFSENTFMVNMSCNYDEIKKLIEKSDIENVSVKDIADDEKTIYIQKYTNNQYCVLKAKMVGTTDMQDKKALSKYNEEIFIPYDVSVKAGRLISAADMARDGKVAVIDEFTAELLFGNENPLGKTVNLNVQESGTATFSNDKQADINNKQQEFEIIGVYSSEKITVENRLKFEKFKAMGNEKLMLNTIIYIPDNIYREMYEETENYTVVFNCENSKEYDRLSEFLEDYQSVYASDFYRFDIITKSDIINALENELKPMNVFMWLILAVLLIISGINSMNTMFFSVKERIGEIGIKKSLGAGKLNITVQFVLEGMFMALMAGILAVICSMWLGGYIGEFIQDNMYISFSVRYSAHSVVLPLAVAGIYGIVFSFVPSFYGANIKVTDALRFE